ncbi:MAG TPA: glycosyltransferase [Gemmatimonadales bacterium]|jgi:glycosyltransferase involved in cell wall biosynthesis|nr:glycosyltransferase [Gemmatimonadales bacterium]
MRILHVVAPGEIGGLERVVHLLAQGQAGTGEEVHVAVVLDRASADHELIASLAGAGVTPHPIVLPGRAYWRERAAILEIVRRLRPVVMHTHGYRPDVLDASVGRRLGIPTVTTVHGFTGGDWKNRLYERLQRRAYRRFDAVVVVSRPLVEKLVRCGVSVQRIHCVLNAWQETTTPLDRVSARRALGLKDGEFVIGWVGRLSREKGADLLLDALAHLTDLPVTVSVIGNGPEQRALVSRARQLGVERLVHWHGTVPEAGSRFSAFDVFVLSSRTEGTPIVLFEAMAAGIPIVAARVGGVPDVVSPMEAALVAPADPAALAAEIRAVYNDYAAGRARAQRARERLRDFTLRPWLDRYNAIYRFISRAAPAGRAGIRA